VNKQHSSYLELEGDELPKTGTSQTNARDVPWGEQEGGNDEAGDAPEKPETGAGVEACGLE
jgi:hypothetical protein